MLPHFITVELDVSAEYEQFIQTRTFKEATELFTSSKEIPSKIY